MQRHDPTPGTWESVTAGDGYTVLTTHDRVPVVVAEGIKRSADAVLMAESKRMWETLETLYADLTRGGSCEPGDMDKAADVDTQEALYDTVRDIRAALLPPEPEQPRALTLTLNGHEAATLIRALSEAKSWNPEYQALKSRVYELTAPDDEQSGD